MRSSLIVGMPTPTGTLWPALPTRANSFVEREVIADHRDVLQRFGPFADQGCTLDWRGDDAVFDEVGFTRREDKLAARDIDLAAAKVHGVEAALTDFRMSPGSSSPFSM